MSSPTQHRRGDSADCPRAVVHASTTGEQSHLFHLRARSRAVAAILAGGLAALSACADRATSPADAIDSTAAPQAAFTIPQFTFSRPSAVAVTVSKAQLAAGDSTAATAVVKDARGRVLQGYPVRWSSASTSVARVSSRGEVTAVAIGSTTVTATAGSAQGSATVTVGAGTAPPSQPPATVPVATVTVTLAAASVAAGATDQAKAVEHDAAGNGLTGRVVAWTSSNAAVATVSSTGLVTAISAGTASIVGTSEGKAGSATVTVTAQSAATPPPVSPPVSPPAGGTANILNNASFESDLSPLTDWSMRPTPINVSRDCTTPAADGNCSAKRTWVPNPSGDDGAQALTKVGSGSNHVWVRFYFKATAGISTVMKFCRFYDSGMNANFGGLFFGSGNEILTFGSDEENEAIRTPIGVTQAMVLDGKWHSVEMDYWRVGDPSGFPSVAFWYDGNPVGYPDGTANVTYAGAGNNSYWKGGRLYAGERNTSQSFGPMTYIEWLATLNKGNTTTGQLNVDKISISTTGRIGP